jgi:predicted hexulose-6-phosphate isomerase
MAKNKPYTLCLYEKAMPSSLSWIEKLKAAKAAGFDAVEISIDETDTRLSRIEPDHPILNELKHAIAETGVPVLTLCLSAHRKYPFGSHDEAIRARSLEIMAKAVDFAQALGIRIIQLAGYDVYYETGDDQTRTWFEVNLRKATELAARSGIVLGFETMETLFMDTATKAMHYVSVINSPYLQIYPDVGNLTNASRISGVSVGQDLHNANGHIVAAHLKEIIEGHYREIPYGTGDTHYTEALDEMVRQGVRFFTGEFWDVGQPTWEKDLAFANTYLREKIESALQRNER